MSREELIDKVKELIEKERAYKVKKDFINQKCDCQDFKNGIYFLYDKHDVVVYVGMVGNGEQTSFAHRMYKHGSGAHCNKPWFQEVEKFRFKSFPRLNEEKLEKIERLMIYAKNQPIFNDKYIREYEHELIANKL